MCDGIDTKPTGIQKILNIFSRSKPFSLSRTSSNHNEIDNLRKDAIAITQPNRKSSLQLQLRQTQRNASLPLDMMSSLNLALHSQQFVNGGGGNVNNNFHISGSEAVHIGNTIQIIKNSTTQMINNCPERAAKPSSSIENETTIEKPKRFSGEQKTIVQSKRSKFIHNIFRGL